MDNTSSSQQTQLTPPQRRNLWIGIGALSFGLIGLLTFAATRAIGTGTGVDASDGQLSANASIEKCTGDPDDATTTYLAIDGECLESEAIPTPNQTPDITATPVATATPGGAGGIQPGQSNVTLSSPVSIFGLGDSIMDDGFTDRLQSDLNAANCSINYGQVAVGGFRAVQILDIVKGDAKAGVQGADMLVVYLGVNNNASLPEHGGSWTGGDRMPATTVNAIKEMITIAREGNPNVMTVIGKIHWGWGPGSGKVETDPGLEENAIYTSQFFEDLNDAFDELAASDFSTADSPIYITDRADITQAEWSEGRDDQIHPTGAAQQKLSDSFYDVIKAEFDAQGVCS